MKPQSLENQDGLEKLTNPRFAAIREKFRTLCQNLSIDEAMAIPLEEVEKYIQREGKALLAELYQAALSPEDGSAQLTHQGGNSSDE